MTLTELIAKLKELEEKITPAPWKYSHGTTMDHWELWSNVEGDPVWEVQDDSGVEPSTEFLEFITQTRNALPTLLKVIEIYRDALEKYAQAKVLFLTTDGTFPKAKNEKAGIFSGGFDFVKETHIKDDGVWARKALSDAEELLK